MFTNAISLNYPKMVEILRDY